MVGDYKIIGIHEKHERTVDAPLKIVVEKITDTRKDIMVIIGKYRFDIQPTSGRVWINGQLFETEKGDVFYSPYELSQYLVETLMKDIDTVCAEFKKLVQKLLEETYNELAVSKEMMDT